MAALIDESKKEMNVMEHFMEEYGSVILAVLSAVAIVGFVITMCGNQGVLYEFITVHCSGAV